MRERVTHTFEVVYEARRRLPRGECEVVECDTLDEALDQLGRWMSEFRPTYPGQLGEVALVRSEAVAK